MNNSESPGKAGLLAGAEVVKYLTALGTGAIVFSAGLLSEKVFLSTAAKWLIFFSWFFLAISVLGGLLAGMRIPVQLSESNHNLEDPYLRYPGLIQQGAFFCGIILLGIGLTVILVGKTDTSETKEAPKVTLATPSPRFLFTPQVTPG